MRFKRTRTLEASMFQENIYPVNNNNNIQHQQHPSLPPSRFQRLRRQNDTAAPSESSPPPSDSAIVSNLLTTSVSIPPVTLSIGVSAPPLSSSEDPSTTESPTPSSSYSVPDTSSASSSDSLSSSSPSSLPSSSESLSTSSSRCSLSTFTPPSTTTQPPFTPPPDDRISLTPMSSQTSSLPPMSSPTSSSSGPTITDTPPPPPPPPPPSSSSSSPTPTMSSSVNSPPPPPPSSSSSNSAPPPPPPPPSSSSSSGLRLDESTSSTPTPPPSTSVSLPPTSISISISVSSPGGGINDISTTSATTPTPTLPSSSSSPSSTPGNVDVGGGSSSSSSPLGSSSADRPGDSTSSPRPSTTTNGSGNPVPKPPTTTNVSGNPVPNTPLQSDGSPAPMTTLSEPVTFTTTDASGSTILTVPPQFTTVIVTTLPGGTFTTVTEVVANPPGVLNQGDANRDSVAEFFQNKGAVAGVFIAISLAICAIVLFVIFALRRRRYRVQNERDAEIAAGLAAAASNQRFADDEDHPVVMRNVPSAMRGRSPWLDDDDDVYHTSAGPVMYNNYTGVGPPTHNMPITSEIAYPLTAARYTHARSNSGSPSPKKDFAALPPTTSFPFELTSPTGDSGWPSHGGGGAYLGGRDSVSPAPTSAPASANHGTATHAATSAGHASSSYGHRPPASVGRDGSGPGTGSGSGSRSGGTSQPSLMTATAAQARASSPKLEDMYPPEYEQFSRRNSSAAVMGYAYEPDPVPHEHQIVTDLREVRGAYEGIRSPLSGDIAMSVGSRSMYSHEGEGSDEDVRPREDSRLDPVMRMTGGLASAASVGPRDHEDYTRRVVPQQLTSPSTGSHSYSLGHSHSTH